MGSEGNRERRRSEAAEEFNRHEARQDGAQIVAGLADGLALLQDCLYHRMHGDVERLVGRDSMIMPLSEMKTEKAARREIETYQIAVSAAMNQQQGYAGRDESWYLPWLARLRLGPAHEEPGVAQRLADYLAMSHDDRRLAFSDVLAKALPESRRAPLILFRLAPLAVRVVTALAFGDRPTASAVRQQQMTLLPAITDCRSCRGKLLEGPEPCGQCGNPLWKFEWLTATD